MKKFRKFALGAISVVAALGLAACSSEKKENNNTTENGGNNGGNNGGDSGNNGDKTETKAIKYQFTGSDTSFASYGFAFTYYLNIYTDGTLDGYGYEMYSLDTTDSASNTHFHKWYEGKWAATKDDDDNDAIRAAVKYADGTAGLTGQAITGTQNVIISYKSDGTTPLNISNFNIPSGISGRAVTLTYMETPYQTANDFINGTVYQFTEPTDSIAYFDDTDNKERIYLFAGGKGDYYGAKLNDDKSLKGYYPKSAVTWAYTDSKLTITVSGTTHEVTIDGKKGTCAWEEALTAEYSTKHNFVCQDVFALTATETGGGSTTYSAGTVYFTYNYNTEYGLKSTFHADYATWTAAVGSATAAYTPVAGNTETLLAFTNDDTSSDGTFVLKKDGSFDFAITMASYKITKSGTFTFGSYKFTFTTTDGSVAVTETSIQGM